MNPSQAESIIFQYFSKKKDTCIFRFQDTKDATSRLLRNKPFGIPYKIIGMDRNPSDFIVCEGGVVYFAEVKHTTSLKGINSGLFAQQKGQRDRIVKCGCPYFYFVYSEEECQWYKIPASAIMENANRKWSELEGYMWDGSN